MPTRIKICGVTNTDDAERCLALGVHAIGINLVPASPRRVEVSAARALVERVGQRASTVLVVANLTLEAMRDLLDETGASLIQLHGDEPPDVVSALAPRAYKALRVAGPADVARAEDFPGDDLLVDAKVNGALGGTGKTVDWDLAAPLARARRLTLAGGLHPENVAQAITRVRPFCVDVASGVERPGVPRAKDPQRLERFVDAVRCCDQRLDRC